MEIQPLRSLQAGEEVHHGISEYAAELGLTTPPEVSICLGRESVSQGNATTTRERGRLVTLHRRSHARETIFTFGKHCLRLSVAMKTIPFCGTQGLGLVHFLSQLELEEGEALGLGVCPVH
jgi:uncharacterized protein YbbK (DUF523 family)